MTKALNYLGFVIGFIGLITTFYFHYSTREKKELSYNKKLEAFKIYDSELLNKSQSISLYKNDTIKVKENVYISTFALWNSGDLPVDFKDIRKPLVVSFSGVRSILDFGIIKQVDPQVSKFTIRQINHNSFSFHWKYFDPNDGVKIQIIYTGSDTVSATIDSKILNTTFNEYIPFRKLEDSSYNLKILSGYFVTLIILIYWWYKNYLPVTLQPPGARRYAVIILSILIAFCLILYLVGVPWMYYKYFFEVTKEPF